MRYNKSKIAILIAFMLLEGTLLQYFRTNVKEYSVRSTSSPEGRVSFKVWNFNHNYYYNNTTSGNNGRNYKFLKNRRFSNHGFRRPAAPNHVPDEEQKRITPYGANPLHNRMSCELSFKSPVDNQSSFFLTLTYD
ncbi:hypothetical protein ACFX13_045694 [Malus domestica]